MFITLTIDTKQISRTKAVRFKKNSMNAARGWHRPVSIKKKSISQKIISNFRKLSAPGHIEKGHALLLMR